jgi:hypothetical protein
MQFNRSLLVVFFALALLSAPAFAAPRHGDRGGDNDGDRGGDNDGDRGGDRDGDRVCRALT